MGVLCFQSKLAAASGRPMVPGGKNAAFCCLNTRVFGAGAHVKHEALHHTAQRQLLADLIDHVWDLFSHHHTPNHVKRSLLAYA